MDVRAVRDLRRILAILLIVPLGACADGSVRVPVSDEALRRDYPELTVVELAQGNIASFAAPEEAAAPTALPPAGNWLYRLGAGDVLNVAVFTDPTTPAGAEAGPGTAPAQVPVQADGTVFYPFAGKVKASGLTVEEMRAALAQKLTAYFPDPQIDVSVAEYNAQSVVVVGEVGTPRSVPLTAKPLQLLEAVNAAGGLTPLADTAHVTVQRGGRVYEVNLYAFLSEGLARNNPLLKPGDIVTVRRRVAREAYVMGSVKAPSVVDLAQEPVTLTQAVARQGGLDEMRADARGLFVFRQPAGRTTVFKLDVSNPEGWLTGNRFPLQPGDVVYVTRSPLSKWNDTISRLLPTVYAGRNVSGS